MVRLAEGPKPFLKQQFHSDPSDQQHGLSFQKGLVCVLMPFQGMESEIAYKAVEDACRSHNLLLMRADSLFSSGLVMRDVERMMSQSEIIIVDLSRERPNVYYELGYVHGIGNMAENVLLVAKSGTRLHFDIAPLRVHFYETASHLEVILNTSLPSMLKFTRSQSTGRALTVANNKSQLREPAKRKPWWRFLVSKARR